MRILGVDYGSVRMGLALGDTDSRLASPIEILQEKNEDAAIQRIRDIVKEERIDRIVVGVPRPLQDRTRETDQAKDIRAFIAKLHALGLDAVEEDETLSTALAAKQASEMGQRGKRDDLAAASILQTYFDRNEN